MSRAFVVSAFPGCGKSTFYRENSIYSETSNGKLKILDSDSSLFSWIYDENGNKTDVRDPEFPNNYISHIKAHIESEDIIFVSSHKIVREALEREGIPYIMVYPDKSLKEEWIKRFRDRGNDEAFIKFQEDHWDEFLDDMSKETYPNHYVIDNPNYGIDNNFIAYLTMIIGSSGDR